MAIESGHLVIKPKSNKPVPRDWLKDNGPQLVNEMADLIGVSIFKYQDFDTGKYGKSKADGVTLKFINMKDSKDAHTIFNVDLKRQHTTKNGMKGSGMAGKRFRITKKYEFYKFWSITNLEHPDRLTKYSSYMGNLKPIIFTGEYDPKDLKRSKLNKKTLKPLNISHCDLVAEIIYNHNTNAQLVNLTCTTRELGVNLTCTTGVNLETQPHQQPRGIELDQSTGAICHGKTLTRKKVTRVPGNVSDTPSNQTVDEWLSDYE